MATFQVVAVGGRGGRFPVRNVHGSFKDAEFHRANSAATFPDETYEIDMLNQDGTIARMNVDGVADLGYPPEEIDAVREWAKEFVARRRAA